MSSGCFPSVSLPVPHSHMGFFQRIPGTDGPGRPVIVNWQGDGNFELEVVGESHYQAAFEAICGPRCEEGEDRIVVATLICDDKNLFDPNAVRVEVAGCAIGHLSREAALIYRALLQQCGYPGADAKCAARITGGWARGARGEGHYGVRLDILAPEAT